MNTAPTLGVVTTDRHLAIRGWNEWIAAATGVAEDDAIGRPLWRFVPAQRADFYRDLLSEVIATGSARVLAPAFHKYLIEAPPLSRSEHFTHMQQRVTIAPLLADAAVVGLIITLEDVTARLDRERSFAALQHPTSPNERSHALASEDWRVRGQAMIHLKQSASVEELRHLFDTLNRDHHDLNVLNSALRVLIAAGRMVVAPLVTMLSDQAANLRMHAALALGELQAQEATPDLVATLDALSKADDARVAPLMVSLLDQELLRPAAVTTLAAIGDEECVPALARALNQEGSEPGPIAGALVSIYQRYENNLGAGR